MASEDVEYNIATFNESGQYKFAKEHCVITPFLGKVPPRITKTMTDRWCRLRGAIL